MQSKSNGHRKFLATFRMVVCVCSLGVLNLCVNILHFVLVMSIEFCWLLLIVFIYVHICVCLGYICLISCGTDASYCIVCTLPLQAINIINNIVLHSEYEMLKCVRNTISAISLHIFSSLYHLELLLLLLL